MCPVRVSTISPVYTLVVDPGVKQSTTAEGGRGGAEQRSDPRGRHYRWQVPDTPPGNLSIFQFSRQFNEFDGKMAKLSVWAVSTKSFV